jgi:hypothetical protein
VLLIFAPACPGIESKLFAPIFATEVSVGLKTIRASKPFIDKSLISKAVPLSFFPK